MTNRLRALADQGVSIWLDDLSRERIESGNLADLIETSSVVGVTTNPTILPPRSPTESGTTPRYAHSPRPVPTSIRRSWNSSPPTSAMPATCSLR